MCNDKELFVSTVSFAIQNGYIELLSPCMIVGKLFALISPLDVLKMIDEIESAKQQNIWKYNFYHELPEIFIRKYHHVSKIMSPLAGEQSLILGFLIEKGS